LEYDLKTIDREIRTIEECAIKLKEIGAGVETIERNADAILAFVYLLKKNVSDIIE
jgi:hypothetical protein